MPTENYSNFEAQGAGWDARQKYTTEIIYRLHLFLNYSRDNLKEKLETLGDIFMTVVPFVDKHEEIRKKIDKIEILLYPPKNTKPEEVIIYKHSARRLIDDVFIRLMFEIKKAGLLVPDKEFTDEVEEFEKLL